MRTIVVGASWITKYFIADTLYNDGNFEEYIQVISPEPLEQFFQGFPKLQEFQGDERLSIVEPIDIINGKELNVEYADSVFLDNETDAIAYIKLLEERKFKKRVVLASSWEVYGWKGRNKVPIDPREETNPETELGKIKKLQEDALKATKLNYVILRYATILGPYMPADSEFITMIHQAMYGDDIIIKGVPSRWLDLVYVTDVIPVIYKALSKLGIDRKIFNVGGYHDEAVPEEPKKNLVVNEKRITDIVRSMRHLMNSESPYVFEPGMKIAQGKGYHSQLDITNTRKTFDYYPNFDSIKLSQFIWWCESIADRSRRITLDMVELVPSLDDNWQGNIQKVGEAMSITGEQFEQQLQQAAKVAKKDQKLEDAQQ